MRNIIINTLHYLKNIFYALTTALIFLYSVQVSAKMPDDLEGYSIFFEVLGDKSSTNPNASFSYIMHFGDDSYIYQVNNSDTIVKGDYSFSTFQDVAIIDAKEIFNGTSTHYKMILSPELEKDFGLYIYSQYKGPVGENSRQNIGRFTILDKSLILEVR